MKYNISIFQNQFPLMDVDIEATSKGKQIRSTEYGYKVSSI